MHVSYVIDLGFECGFHRGGNGITFPDGTVMTSAPVRDPRRWAYITQTTFSGAEAGGPSPCEDGYHFASLYEMLDPSSFTYDPYYGGAEAYRDQDINQPPTNSWAWIRTGFPWSSGPSSSGSIGDAGLRNCDGYTLAGFDDWGTIVALNPCWEEDADCSMGTFWGNAVAPWWLTDVSRCSSEYPIWCIEEFPGSSSIR